MADMGAGSSSGADSRHRSMGSKGLLVFVGIKTGLVPLPVLSIAYLLLRLGSPFLGPLGITNRVSLSVLFVGFWADCNHCRSSQNEEGH